MRRHRSASTGFARAKSAASPPRAHPAFPARASGSSRSLGHSMNPPCAAPRRGDCASALPGLTLLMSMKRPLPRAAEDALGPEVYAFRARHCREGTRSRCVFVHQVGRSGFHCAGLRASPRSRGAVPHADSYPSPAAGARCRSHAPGSCDSILMSISRPPAPSRRARRRHELGADGSFTVRRGSSAMRVFAGSSSSHPIAWRRDRAAPGGARPQRDWCCPGRGSSAPRRETVSP